MPQIRKQLGAEDPPIAEDAAKYVTDDNVGLAR